MMGSHGRDAGSDVTQSDSIRRNDHLGGRLDQLEGDDNIPSER